MQEQRVVKIISKDNDSQICGDFPQSSKEGGPPPYFGQVFFDVVMKNVNIPSSKDNHPSIMLLPAIEPCN